MNSFIATANDLMMRVMLGATPGTNNGGGSGKFDIIKFLNNATEYLKQVGHYIMLLAGVILIIVAAVQIAKGLAGGGRGQVNWVMSIGCLLVGGIMLFGGWKLMSAVSKTGADTLAQMGGMEGIGDADSVENGATGSGLDQYANGN